MAASPALSYVEVFLQLSPENDRFEVDVNDFVLIANLLSAPSSLRDFLCSPSVELEKRESVLRGALENAGTSSLVTRVVLLLLRKGRLLEMEHIALVLQEKADRRLNILRGRVETATELDDEMRGKIESTISRKNGRVSLSYGVKPELLGGLTVRLRQTKMDASLSNQLEQAKAKLMKQSLKTTR